MRLLLIHTPFTFPITPPSGIAYLKGFIKNKLPELNVKCLDLNLEWYKRKSKESKTKDFFKFSKEEKETQVLLSSYLKTENLGKKIASMLKGDINKINEFRPDVVGFSILLRSQLAYALALSKLIKSKDEKIKIIFGGASLSGKDFHDVNKLVYCSKLVDFIIREAAESQFLSILKNLNIRPKIRKNERKLECEKPFALSYFPDYSDFDLDGYFIPKVILPIHISKGCTWARCTFCQAAMAGPKFISKEISKIINEIKFLKNKYNACHFYFIAPEVPAFLLNKIADALIRNKLKIYYSAYVRPTSCINNALLKKLYKSGCRIINYGIESFTQRILDLMNKGTHVKDILNLLKRTKKVRIKTYCWYIIGFPSQTEEELRNELSIIRENSQYIDLFGCHTFFLKKHSLIYNNGKLLILDKDKPELFLEIGGIKIFKDEQINFKATSGVNNSQASKWADIMGREFTFCKKNSRSGKISSDLREFYVLSSIK